MIKYIFDNVIFLCFLPKCVVCDWRGGMGGGQRFEQLMYFYHWQFTEFSSRHWGSSSWTIWIWTIPGLHTWAVWPIARFWACQSEPGWLSGSSPDCLSCTEYRWPGRIVNIYDCSKTLLYLWDKSPHNTEPPELHSQEDCSKDVSETTGENVTNNVLYGVT